MTNIERYVAAQPSTESVLARVPGTTAYAHRRQDVERHRRHEAELEQVAHDGAIEEVRIVYAAAHARASMEASGMVAATTLRVAAAVADVAEEAFRTGSAVRQALILDAMAAVGPELNRVGQSHTARFRAE